MTTTIPSVTPTASTGATSATAGTIAGAQQSLASDQQTFLKLLTTQLQNQDPLNPTDTNQFTQQLVAMTGVQQQIIGNQLLQQLVSNQSGMGDPVGMIGKTVSASTNAATLQGGQASWLYSLPSAAAKVQVQIYDSLNRLVYQSNASSQAAGEQAVSWNGKDLTGTQLADGGTYTLAVTATDASGATVAPSIYQRGTAASVEQDSGQTYVTINGVKIKTSAVTSVGT